MKKKSRAVTNSSQEPRGELDDAVCWNCLTSGVSAMTYSQPGIVMVHYLQALDVTEIWFQIGC